MKVTLGEFLGEMENRELFDSPENAWMAKLWSAMAKQLWEDGPSYDPDEDLPEDNEWIRSNPEWIQANPPPMEAVIGYGLDLTPKVGVRASERYNKNHGKDGKFTSGKAAVSATMLAAAHEPDGGATISTHGDVPQIGYVIAQPGTSGFVGVAGEMYGPDGLPTEEGIAKAVAYMDAHQDAEYLGVWHNPATGEITFDVVDVLPDDIGEDEAKKIGKERNQEAIFHLTTMSVIETGGTGDARSQESDLETTQADLRDDRRREEGVRQSTSDGGQE